MKVCSNCGGKLWHFPAGCLIGEWFCNRCNWLSKEGGAEPVEKADSETKQGALF